MLISGYDKADTRTLGGRPSVRFLLAEHSALWTTYLTYVRPFEE